MARHLWHNKTFALQTIESAQEIFEKCLHRGWAYPVVVAVVGYALEAQRQSGASLKIGTILDRAERGNYRFTRGKNLGNYTQVGGRLIGLFAPSYGLDEGTPACVVYDKYKEQEGLE